MINNDGKKLFAEQTAQMKALAYDMEGLGSFVKKNIEVFEGIRARTGSISTSVGVSITPRTEEFTRPFLDSDSSTPTPM